MAVGAERAALLFTDIEGSTQLWEQEPDRMRAALETHDELVLRCIGEHRGHVFSTSGDGFAVWFAGVGNAVDCAIEIQRRLQTVVWPTTRRVGVRMGVHAGHVYRRDANVFGQSVNRAARVSNLASAGQLVLSREAADDLVDPRYDLIELGNVAVRGIDEPISVVGVDCADVPWLDVPLRTTTSGAGGENELVGRLAALQEVRRAITTQRVVTITGAGGVGKTRLANEVAWRAAGRFPDGSVSVELAPLEVAAGVVHAVATELGAPLADSAAVDAVVDALGDRRMLLVLDNAEHVLGGVVPLVEAIIERCPGVHVLVTSREPLRVPAEIVSVLPPLEPDSEAVDLFWTRLREAGVSHERTHERQRLVAEICRRLDGVPLAVELAAAGARTKSLPELLAMVAEPGRLSSTGRAAGRASSLRATIDWSLDALTPAQQALLGRLAVFAGGFDAASAALVTDGAASDEALQELLDRSLISVDVSGAAARLGMLEVIRQLARERLGSLGVTDAEERHARHFIALAAQRRPVLERPVEEDLAFFALEWANLRIAHAWAVAHDVGAAQSLMCSTRWFAFERLRSEHADWCRATAETLGAPDPETWGTLAQWRLKQGDNPGAVQLATEAIGTHADPHDASLAYAWASAATGWFQMGKEEEVRAAIGDLDAVESRMVESLERFNVCLTANICGFMGDLGGVTRRRDRLACYADEDATRRGWLSFIDGMADLYKGRADGARIAFERAAELATEAHSDHLATTALGMIPLTMGWGGTGEDSASYRVALDELARLNNWQAVWYTIEGIARSWELTHPDDAAVVTGHLDAHHRASRPDHAASVAQATARPNGPALMRLGASMRRGEVLAYVLERLQD